MLKHNLLLMVLFFTYLVFGQIKRSRAEAIPEISASNTIGMANIWSRSYLSFASIKDSAFVIEPYQMIGLGLSDYMSVFAGTVPFENGIKKIIGKSNAHLKITLPFNDNLRLLGVGIQGDMVLTTEQDTLSEGQSEERPSFAPKIGLTVSADVDLIKLYNKIPVKIYLNWSMFDNDRLLAKYNQHSIRFGVEYKGPKHSIYTVIKGGFYKRFYDDPKLDENSTYNEQIITLIPGLRYRFLNRFSLLASLYIPIIKKVNNNTPLYNENFKIRLGVEFPIFYRETNAEAIRAMIFLEKRNTNYGQDKKFQKKYKDSQNAEFSIFTVKEDDKNQSVLKEIEELDKSNRDREKEIIERRKKIDKELKEIEQLIEKNDEQ